MVQVWSRCGGGGCSERLGGGDEVRQEAAVKKGRSRAVNPTKGARSVTYLTRSKAQPQ